MITDIVLIWTIIYSWYLIIKEIIWVNKFCRRNLYVYWSKKHSNHHILILILLLIYWLTMNMITLYESDHYIISFVYNLLLVPAVVKHLYLERVNNLNNENN